MTEWHLVVGPPGTGKTTALLGVLRRELLGGVHPSRVAFWSFTRAARLEALARVTQEIGLNEDDMPWLRTVHSAAYKLTSMRPDTLMLDERWQEFAKRYGYELSDVFGEDAVGAPIDPAIRTNDDALRYVLLWGRSRRYSLAQTHARSRVLVHGRELTRFAERYEEYKASHGLSDFTDMVETAIRRGNAPSVDVAFIDEAQDLSPLDIAAIQVWTEDCKRVYVAGDPDQAIYHFRGATPDWMLSLGRRATSTTYLVDSHRVPVSAYAISRRIITPNRDRLPSTYRPAARAGTVETIDLADAIRSIDLAKGAFVLSRNRYFLRTAGRALFDAALPYVIEGGRAGTNPYGSSRLLRAMRTALSIHRGQTRIAHDDVEAMLSWVPPRSGLVQPGSRQIVQEMRGNIDVEPVSVSAGFEPLIAALKLHPTKPIVGLSKGFQRYFQTIIDTHQEIPAPKIRLMTMHGSKGREHDHVVVLSDHTATVDTDCRHGDWESENRIRYVAVTRTRERLTIARPTGRKYYEYPVERRAS